MALELSPRQISTLERLVAAGFRPIAIPQYESALCMRKGECGVVLAPVPNGGLRGAGSAFLFSGWEFWGAAEAWEWGSVCVEEVGGYRDAGWRLRGVGCVSAG